jgi:hypothetical protein
MRFIAFWMFEMSLADLQYRPGRRRSALHALAVCVALALALAGCASREPAPEQGARLTPVEGRALIRGLLPSRASERSGWATDIYAAFAAMQLPVTAANVCAVVGITEQESGFRVDPVIPGLPRIAWREIERQRERLALPKLVVSAALALPSPDGRSYSERIDKVRTERELSDIFEDFIGMVPLGRTLLADRNPVHTAGPMQVSIAFAEQQAKARPYPYPVNGSLRHELFTRRGGMYFGIAHLLDYRAPYDSVVYRFADFNAGRYASRNAAFQKAVSQATGIPLVLDGDLLRYGEGRPLGEASATEAAARVLGKRIGLSNGEIRDGLARGRDPDFEKSTLYRRVFALADRSGRAPRAVVPDIRLESPKITRRLTTAWFANRVMERYRSCMTRASAGAATPPGD